MNFLTNLFSGGVVREGIKLASEYIEDPDLRNQVIMRVIEAQGNLEAIRLQTKTVPWVDAMHKMIRPVMWLSVIGVYFYCKVNSIDIDASELMMLSAGPGVYTMMKGKGR